MALATPSGKRPRKAPRSPTDQPFRWTRATLHRAIKTGFIDEDAPFELIKGELYPKMPQSPEHAYSIRAAAHLLGIAFDGGYFIQQQLPVGIGRDSEPEPDISVLRGEYKDFGGDHPRPADVALIVEVSESSERKDRVIKANVYAEAGIAEYWVLLVKQRRLERFCDPGALPDGDIGYRRIESFGEGEKAASTERPSSHIKVGDLLPPMGNADANLPTRRRSR